MDVTVQGFFFSGESLCSEIIFVTCPVSESLREGCHVLVSQEILVYY
jgi:hypothetical protein